MPFFSTDNAQARIQADARAGQLEAEIARMSAELERQQAAAADAAVTSSSAAGARSTSSAEATRSTDLVDDGVKGNTKAVAFNALPSGQPCANCEHHQLQAHQATMLAEALQTEAAGMRLAKEQLRAQCAGCNGTPAQPGVEHPLNPRTVSELLNAGSRCKQLEVRCATLDQEVALARQDCENVAQLARTHEAEAKDQKLWLEAHIQSLASEHEQLKLAKAAADQTRADLQSQISLGQAQHEHETAALEDANCQLEDKMKVAAVDRGHFKVREGQLLAALSGMQSAADESSHEKQGLKDKHIAMEQDLQDITRKLQAAESKCAQPSNSLEQQSVHKQDEVEPSTGAVESAEASEAEEPHQLHEHHKEGTGEADASNMQIQAQQIRIGDLVKQIAAQHAAHDSEAKTIAVALQAAQVGHRQERQDLQAELAAAHDALSEAQRHSALDLEAAETRCRELTQKLKDCQAASREAQQASADRQDQASSQLEDANSRFAELLHKWEKSTADLSTAQAALETEQKEDNGQPSTKQCGCRQLKEKLNNSQAALQAALANSHARMDPSAVQTTQAFACAQVNSVSICTGSCKRSKVSPKKSCIT